MRQFTFLVNGKPELQFNLYATEPHTAFMDLVRYWLPKSGVDTSQKLNVYLAHSTVHHHKYKTEEHWSWEYGANGGDKERLWKQEVCTDCNSKRRSVRTDQVRDRVVHI